MGEVREKGRRRKGEVREKGRKRKGEVREKGKRRKGEVREKRRRKGMGESTTVPSWVAVIQIPPSFRSRVPRAWEQKNMLTYLFLLRCCMPLPPPSPQLPV